MNKGIKGIALFTSVGAALLLAAQAQASHARPFLDELSARVNDTLVTQSNTLTKAQRQALTTAQKALARKTRTVSADLGAFATATTALNKQFGTNAELRTLQVATLNTYSEDVWLDLYASLEVLGTNSLSKGQSNLLSRATNALTRADAMTNSPARARSMAAAVNKLSAAVKQITKNYTAPAALPHDVDLVEDAPSNSETTRFYFKVFYDQDHPEGYYAFTADNPEEVGLWSYERTGPKTGVIHLNVNYGDPYPPFNHDLTLTFESPRRGTFTGVNGANESIKGTFVVH